MDKGPLIILSGPSGVVKATVVRCPDAVSVFLHASSLDGEAELRTLEQRLRARGTESEEAVLRRLAGARRELARAGEYDYQVINDDLARAVADVAAIIHAHWEGG